MIVLSLILSLKKRSVPVLKSSIMKKKYSQDLMTRFFRAWKSRHPILSTYSNSSRSLINAEELNWVKIKSSILFKILKVLSHDSKKSEFDGKLIINNSKATNLKSVEDSLKAFSQKKIRLLLGGKRRETKEVEKKNIEDFKNQYPDLDIRLFGEVSELFGKKMELSMLLSEMDLNFDVLLFSPGYPSFDQFKNYLERGREFSALSRQYLSH